MNDDQKRADYAFHLYVEVYDPEQLRAAALAHPDAINSSESFLDADGRIDIGACLIMLLDPGTLPGCEIQESQGEWQEGGRDDFAADDDDDDDESA